MDSAISILFKKATVFCDFRSRAVQGCYFDARSERKYSFAAARNKKKLNTAKTTTCTAACDQECQRLITTWKAIQAIASQRAQLRPRSRKIPATIASTRTSETQRISLCSGWCRLSSER